MKQVPDRKKLRREYLRRKAIAYGIGGLVPVLSLIFGLWLYHSDLNAITRHGFLFCVLLVYFVWIAVKVSREAIKGVPYVPPIVTGTLPADEILVRGSDQPPVAQSEVLVRAANEQETPKEELLRVSQED
jgi:hypothetical protein